MKCLKYDCKKMRMRYVDTKEKANSHLFEADYLGSPRNGKIAGIINAQGCCGSVLQIYDVLELAPENWSVLCKTTDGPLWGVIISDGDVAVSSGTGLLTAGEFLAEYIRTDGDTEQ